MAERSDDAVRILAAEYQKLYYVNLETGDYTDFSVAEDVEKPEDIVRGRVKSFDNVYRMFVVNNVHPEDRARMFKEGDTDSIKRNLRGKYSYSTTFRCDCGGEYKAMRMTVSKGGDINRNPASVTVAFAFETQPSEDMSETKLAMQSLMGDFEYVIGLNLNTNAEIHYRTGDIFLKYIPDWAMMNDYAVHMETFIGTLVYEDDRNDFREKSRRHRVMDELKDKPAYYVNFRIFADGEIMYYQCKYVRSEKAYDQIIVGFHRVDDETVKATKDGDMLRQNFEIIEILASEYTSVYYIDLTTDALTPYTMNEDTESEFGNIFRSGITYSSAFKMYVDTLIYDEDRDMMLGAGSVSNIRHQLTDKKSFVTTYRSDNDGNPHYCEMKFVKVGNEIGTPKAVALGFADKDEEIRQEQERQRELSDAMKRAEAANEAKTTFLFNMSHDIRTPMNAIIGFTDMAYKYKDNPEKVEDCLNKVKMASDHLLMLINDVLDMSRIESGKINIEESEADIYTSVDRVVSIATQTAKVKDIDFKVKFKNIIDSVVYIDSLHMNQVLLNVISNAIKYTAPGGKVTFYVEQIQKSGPDGYATFEYTIKDQGIGMSEDFVNKIFEPFTRESTSTVSGIQGTGLGMTIAKRLTDMMGGDIKIESALGMGTSVTITIGFKKCSFVESVEEEDVFALPKEDEVIKGKKLLLVEDNELNREIARDILEDAGLAVEEADDGSVAVAMAKEKGPGYYDFILMDIQMPIMNGYDATKAIRGLGDEAFEKIPIIAMTANAFEEDKQKSRAMGMNEHLAKPVVAQELIDTLKRFAYANNK